ncbi:MAG TPA: shikimate kinase, partial [Acidimicrobiia bacterium]|nr:shikimate kinase [Acidimicrobiia bacterium]
MAGRHVVLVGLMGAGKTTVGRALAGLLGRPLVDNDAQIVSATGATVADISAAAGVAEMRRLESAALTAALASPEPAVITAAAGTVLDADVRHRLAAPFVVWLRARPATVAGRVGHDPARPLLGDDPLPVL